MITVFNCHYCVQVLLVFPKRDAQCDGFVQAAEKAKYACQVVRTGEAALQTYAERHHEVIIVDTRQEKALDAVSLCR